jgi:hypothetical protein
MALKSADIFFGEIAGPTCGEGMNDEDWEEEEFWDENHSEDSDDRIGELNIPYGQLPPEGECKLWNPDLEDGQQSKPIPCDCSYIDPQTFLIDHEGDVIDCDRPENGDVNEEETDYASFCTGLDIPSGQYPPPGECKVWDPDLDDGQQAEPVSCDCANISPGTCLIDHYGEIVSCE